MTDAIQSELARILGHGVAMRNRIIENAAFLFGHKEAVPTWHPIWTLMDDFQRACTQYVRRFNEEIAKIDPNAEAVELAPPTAPAAPSDAYAGVMVQGDPVEALRTHRMGQVIAKARALATERYTYDEAARLQQLHSQSLAAETNAAPALTDDEIAELTALEADRSWAVSTRDYADTLIDTLIGADEAALEAFDPEEGWPA